MASRTGGVIHDIGYRPYEGRRLSEGSIAWSLFRRGYLEAFGIGRSARAKILPMTMAVLMLIPALVIVSIIVLVSLAEGFLNYSTYINIFSVGIVIFVSGQAPVLFTRDLRSGAISLYLARPLPTWAFALIRCASLATAIFTISALPLLLMFIGAVSNEADFTDQAGDFFPAVLSVLILSVILASITGLISALTTRRGFAVGAILITLWVSSAFVSAVQAIADFNRMDDLGQFVGLLSPFSLADGIQSGLLGGTASFFGAPEGIGMILLYVVTSIALVLGSLLLLIRSYRRKAK